MKDSEGYAWNGATWLAETVLTRHLLKLDISNNHTGRSANRQKGVLDACGWNCVAVL